MEESRNEMMHSFCCDYVGNMDEYVECKIVREEGIFTFTHTVMLQSFKEEFYLPTQAPNNPGEPGNTLSKARRVNQCHQRKQHNITK